MHKHIKLNIYDILYASAYIIIDFTIFNCKKI